MENSNMISSILNWATSKVEFVEIEHLCYKLFKSNLDIGLTDISVAILLLRKQKEGISVSINLTYEGLGNDKPILNSFNKVFSEISDLPKKIAMELDSKNEVKINITGFYQNILLTNGEKIRNKTSFNELQALFKRQGFNETAFEGKRLLIKDELFKMSATIYLKGEDSNESNLTSKRFVFSSISNLPDDIAEEIEKEGKILLTLN